jgi:hypothetical protein
MRWPGHIPAGVVVNDIGSHLDMLPTLLAVAGEPDINEKLLHGHEAGRHTYKVHLDGYNLVPFLTVEGERSPRQGFFYFSDDGDLVALRFDNWKAVFMEQRATGTMQIWAEPFVPLRIPKLYNLRTTRTNAPTSRPTPTTTGSSTGPTWCSPRPRSPVSFWLRSRTARPARRRHRSPSTRRWRSSRPASPAPDIAALADVVRVRLPGGQRDRGANAPRRPDQ